MSFDVDVALPEVSPVMFAGLVDTVGDDRFFPGVGCHVPLDRQDYDDITDWDDSDSYGYGLPVEFEFYDHRDYDAGWERRYVEEADDYWLTDHLHENGEFVYVKDAFGPEFAPVALSMGEGAADQIEFSTSELPDNHRDAAMAPRDVPAVSGTGVCSNGESDMTMAVFSPDNCDSIRAAVRPLGLLPSNGASVAHPEVSSAWLKRTVSVWTRGIPGRPSPLIAVGRPDVTLPTSAFGVDLPEVLCTVLPGAVLAGTEASTLSPSYIFC